MTKRLLKEQLSATDIENYDLEKPLRLKKEKDKIYRPFKFRGNTLLFDHRIKNSKYRRYLSRDSILWFSKSVGFGYQDAKFQGVSGNLLDFKIDEKMVNEVLKEKISREEIPTEEEVYEKRIELSESERYFYRDDTGEAEQHFRN